MDWFDRIRAKVRFYRLPWWEHFIITFADDGFAVVESKANRRKESRHGKWSDVACTTFVDGGLASDVFYIHLSGQERPVLVPTESSGGTEFWQQLQSRGLFPDAVSGAAMRSSHRGNQFVWPAQPG